MSSEHEGTFGSRRVIPVDMGLLINHHEPMSMPADRIGRLVDLTPRQREVLRYGALLENNCESVTSSHIAEHFKRARQNLREHLIAL